MPETKGKKVVEIEEDYICPLSAKTISEIEDPVLSPYGHIYERADLIGWIAKSGGKDPMDVSKPLTVAMLIPSFAIKEIVTKHKSDMAKIKQQMKDKDEQHAKDMGDIKDLLKGVLEQNALLNKQAVKATWREHGQDIDKKLKKGSSTEREKALKDYKDKVLQSENEVQLKAAVQDVAPLKKPEISSHRYLSWFRDFSSTTTVALEFNDKVTASKGW